MDTPLHPYMFPSKAICSPQLTKTYTRRGMKKRPSHERLKAMRKIIGLTQQELAGRVGVSYPSILAVETGQRPMTKRLAMLIACATDICPVWLMNDAASPAKPLTTLQQPYTREYFQTRFGHRARLTKERHL